VGPIVQHEALLGQGSIADLALEPFEVADLGLGRAMQLGNNAGLAMVATMASLAGIAGIVGFKFLTAQEQIRTGFVTLLKDAKLADDTLKRVVETAAVTPFQTSDLAQGVRSLLNYGFQLDEVLKGAGKSASGLAITIGDAVAAARSQERDSRRARQRTGLRGAAEG
jgi:hypothetical protein